MKRVKFEQNFTTTIGGFFQYDYGQILDVYGTNATINNLQFQFIQDGEQITVLGEYQEDTNSYKVRIPDSFLQKTSEILCYIYYEDETLGETIKIIIIKINSREKYEDIPDPEHKGVVEQILEMIAHLQDEIDNFELTPEQMQQIISEVEEEIDLTNYYDKTETDAKLAQKADKTQLDNYLTITDAETAFGTVQEELTLQGERIHDLEIDVSLIKTSTIPGLQNQINEKADSSNVYTKSQVYTKTEIDATIGDIQTLLEGI